MIAALALLAGLAAADGGAGATSPANPETTRPPTHGAPAPAAAAAATPLGAPPVAAAGEAAGEPAGTRAKAKGEHARGLAELKAGHAAAAEELFARAAKHEPTSAAYATDWGFALGKLGRRAEAEAALRGAIEKDPKRFYAYVNLADLLAEDPGRWERRDAIEAFLDQGLGAVKDDRKGRFNLLVALAGFERAVGRTAEARARLAPLVAPDAPPLSRVQRKRVLDLLEAIALDERARALEDWPAPAPETARRLVAAARAAEAGERVDEAIRELEIAVNLAPSDAEAWRSLGRLLAVHGGALEVDRADDALRHALAMEPAWSDLRELRAQIARRRGAAAASTAMPRARPPSDKARALYQEAEDWTDVGDPIGLGRDLLEQALADSPGFVAAAVSLYALTGRVAPETVDALHDDGPGLWALASGVRKLGAAHPTSGAQVGSGEVGARAPERDPDAVEAMIRPWIDRAVELDVQEARFARAVARAAAGDRSGALADLVAYLGREPAPEHLAEARALRAGLSESGGARDREGRLTPQLVARIRLIEDRPDAALRALGGTCAPGLPAERLLAIGLVHEYADQRTAARRCYELGAAADDGVALARLGRLDARLPDAELGLGDRRLIDRAAAAGVAAAFFARARLEAEAGDERAALLDARRALGRAAQDSSAADVWLPAARAVEQELAQSRRASEEERRSRRRQFEVGALALVLLALGGLARRRWRGKTVAAALRRRPGLYPEVARAIAELRHDVLKHRAGVLGAALAPGAERADVRRAFLEPRPTSTVVAGLYDKLGQVARGGGLALKPLGREPVFGALGRDLARAEHLLARPETDPNRAELAAIDGRLRGAHADALAALLELGPRTRLDAAVLSSWIAGVEAASRRAGRSWIAPGLSLADLDLEFPVDGDALATVFTNLLRNAEAAVTSLPEPRVVVRLDRERDAAGRPLVTLFVGDSAPTTPTLESIEARESGRGLAIVRDLVREWRGHLAVRPEAGPITKLVGACFPT